MSNLFHSALILLGMLTLLSFSSWLILGANGMIWAFILGLPGLLLSPHISAGAMLRLHRARSLTRQEFSSLHSALDELAQRAELPSIPKLYYVPSSTPNAFAVGGKESAAVALTDGLLGTLNLRELIGILAHEVSHIRHNDIWIMGLADVVSRITSAFSIAGQLLLFINLPLLLFGGQTISWLFIIILILAPTLSTLMQLALLRTREFDADLDAAALSSDPVGLASALKKIERSKGGFWEGFFLPGRREKPYSILRTHPETEERVRRLLSLVERPRTRGPMHTLFGEGVFAMPSRFHRVAHSPQWHLGGKW
jgi:heat shock protein HtpX